MLLSEPSLRKRIDKSQPQENPVLKNPINIFKEEWNSCIHFGAYGGAFSVIRLLTSNEPIVDKIDYEGVVKSLQSVYPNNEYLNEFIYYAKHDIEFEILIIYDDVNWKLENNRVISIDFKLIKEASVAFIKSIKVMNQKDYQRKLVSKFGINRTNKPLIYSTTEFESYLSDLSISKCERDDITLFPGDVDLITFNKNYETLNIYEFKKHTKFGYGDIEHQSFRKYFWQDKKKYYGLAALANKLGKKYFFNIIYSIRYGELNKVKVEKIDINLKLIDDYLINFKTVEDLKKLIDEYCNELNSR